MPRHRFDRHKLVAAPWKNGGGQTQEIASRPAKAGISDFHWRVSIASIATDGPFSVFPGVDRVITLLDGPSPGIAQGVRLMSADGSIDHRLDTPLQPFAFAGDVALDCRLLAGPSADFNLMVRRDRGHATLSVLTAASALPSSPEGMIFAARGNWTAEEGIELRSQCGLWWDGDDAIAYVSPGQPARADSALIVVQWWPAK